MEKEEEAQEALQKKTREQDKQRLNRKHMNAWLVSVKCFRRRFTAEVTDSFTIKGVEFENIPTQTVRRFNCVERLRQGKKKGRTGRYRRKRQGFCDKLNGIQTGVCKKLVHT